jgi:[protein-PII] uridylyltransferase
VQCAVQPRFGQPPDPATLRADLRRAESGQLPLDRLVRAARAGSHRQPPEVRWYDGVATGAVVLEVRAADSPGLLYRIVSALAGLGADIRAARVSTLGADVVDAFYLAGCWSDLEDRTKVTDAVLQAAA